MIDITELQAMNGIIKGPAMTDITPGSLKFEPDDIREGLHFYESGKEILRFQHRDNALALVIDGKDIWTGPDSVAFARWLAGTVAAIDTAEADTRRADRLAALVTSLMDGTIEIDDAPLHVGEWYTDIAAALAAYLTTAGETP